MSTLDDMMVRQFGVTHVNGRDIRLPKKTKTSKTSKPSKTTKLAVVQLPPARLLRATAAYLRDLEESVYTDALAKGPKVLSSMLEALADVEEAGC